MYKQTRNGTKHTYTKTDLFWIVIDLMFDFDIPLFMLSMWITIISYLIIVMSLFSFNVVTHICYC